MKKLLTIVAAAMLATSAWAGDKVKVGFVYVGPTGDHGWTYRHDIGRQDVEDHFGDQVETFFVESVSEGPDAERVINAMVLQGADIIFTTSFGYMDATLKMANRYPHVKFEHATGYKQAKNMSSYGLRLYQARHVQGVIAGLMTKSNKICYIGAYPIPEVIREINTYFMGARSMNPNVEMDIIWVNTWYDPGKESDAAKVLMGQGCDMVAQHTDSPAPMQAAEQQGKFGFGQASDQIAFAPEAQLTATIDNWSPYYIRKVQAVIDGNWESENYFGHMNEDVVQMAPFTNMPDDVRAIAQKVKDAISNGEYFAFTGPIRDQAGEIRIQANEVATDGELNSMNYYVEGITARFPD
jgi:simple sugar transport system substrate-binding protein